MTGRPNGALVAFALTGGLACLLAASSADAVATRREVQMAGNRFAPAEIAARAGDTIRFINGNGGPHNIQFFSDSIPESIQRILDAAMTGNKWAPLSSPLLLNPREVYDFMVPVLAPGRYPFFCVPHFGKRMMGALVVIP